MLKPGQIITTFKTKKGREIVVRVVDKNDAQKLYDFFHPLVAEDVFLAKSPTNNVTLKDEKKFIKGQLQKIKKDEGFHLVAWYNSKIVGSITLAREPFRSKHVGDVGLAITKDFRGEGLGFNLLSILEKLAKEGNYKIFYLTCFTINEPALSLYEKFGFKRCGFLPKAYLYKKKYEDQVMMWKEII